jgi:hypothetical protein
LTPNIRLRAALCLALSLADLAKAHADEPVPARMAPVPDSDENPCVTHAQLVDSWRVASRAARTAERVLERAEAQPVMASEGHCSDAAYAAGRCRDTYFSRDQEIEKARDALDDAQSRVTQVEDSARLAGVPDLCLVD